MLKIGCDLHQFRVYVDGSPINKPHTCNTFPTTHLSIKGLVGVYQYRRRDESLKQLFHSPQKAQTLMSKYLKITYLPRHPNSQGAFILYFSVQASLIWVKYLSTDRMLIRRGETCLVMKATLPTKSSSMEQDSAKQFRQWVDVSLCTANQIAASWTMCSFGFKGNLGSPTLAER